jgi:hypothetical protein
VVGRIRSIEKSNDLIGNRTPDISRQYQLVLLVEVHLRKGSENVKFNDAEFVMRRGVKLSRGFTAYDRNCYINVSRAALE